MRSIITIGFLLSMFLPAMGNSPQQTPAASRAGSSQTVPGDLRIPAILKVTLSSKKSKIGDPVKLEVAADVHGADGTVVIPRHARLTGQVTRVVRYQKNKQAAMLAFTVERVEWKDHAATLNASVYGADVLATDARRGELVEGIHAATLGVDQSLDIVSTEIFADTRVGSVGSGYAHALRDTSFQNVIMYLNRVDNSDIKSEFMRSDGDLQVPSEFLLVLLNGN